MKSVVFGGAGFLGSHIADVLSESGHQVTIYDLKSSPYLKKKQKMVVGDVLDEKKVEKVVKNNDIVYNFSGIADIDETCKRPLQGIKTNILGNTIILEACRKAAIKRFIYASSLYIYSKAGSFYRSSKQACELIIENYNEIFGLPYTILRFGSLYGPRADERNFIHRTLRQALLKGTIVREGDGEEIRDYIHVLDAAKGSVEILSNEYVNQYVIITGNQQMKVKDLLLMLKEMLGNKIKIRYTKAKSTSHYEITPYYFAPKLAKRLVHKTYLDLGQGLLDCVYNLHKDSKAK